MNHVVDRFVTTPYCSGLSLLHGGKIQGQSPGLRNHPLLFGTVSPTWSRNEPSFSSPKVTTPYCSGLSLLHPTQKKKKLRESS